MKTVSNQMKFKHINMILWVKHAWISVSKIRNCKLQSVSNLMRTIFELFKQSNLGIFRILFLD